MSMRILLVCVLVLNLIFLTGQNVASSPEYIKALTSDWNGERFSDGRPKVSDDLLERLKQLTIEEVWAELIELGYQNQFEGNWQMVDETDVTTMTGRVVTAQFMPLRPDLEKQVIEQGKKEGHAWQQKRTVSWAINTLVEGDVYVADAYCKPHLGTVVGSNLGNGLYEKTKRGGIFYGHVRDMADLRKIKGFNAWIKGSDPSYMRQTLLTTINAPVRIGNAIVLPGDAVLAKREGVIFIPPHLLEHIVLTGEVTAIFDIFGQQRIKEGKYTAGEIDSKWSEEIKKDFRSWASSNQGMLPMSLKDLNSYLEKRNF